MTNNTKRAVIMGATSGLGYDTTSACRWLEAGSGRPQRREFKKATVGISRTGMHKGYRRKGQQFGQGAPRSY